MWHVPVYTHAQTLEHKHITNVNFKTGKLAESSQCYKLTENIDQRRESHGKKVRTKDAPENTGRQAYFHGWTTNNGWMGR